MNHLRTLVGLVVWLATGIALSVWVHGQMVVQREDGYNVAAELWEFAAAKRRFVRLQLDEAWPLAVGDPIYRIDRPGSIEQVGEIRRLLAPDAAKSSGHATGPVFEALLYPHAPSVNLGTYLKYYTTPRSMRWVIETMLPAEKRARIAQEIVATYKTYHAEILDAVKPIIVASLFDALRVAEEELSHAIAERRGEFEKLAGRYQEELVQQEIVPLVRQQIWPIIRQHAEPLANRIGEEMFARASVWRFGWRLAYDKSFLPEKNLTQAEWNRFVDQEAVPILSRHQADFAEVQRQIVEEIARNEKVRDAVRLTLTRVVDDAEFRALAWQILRDAVIDNPRIRDALEQRWKTAEARRAVQLAAAYVEPCVRRIGDLLIGSRADGIAPEFAQVVRNQILDKDCRWLVIVATNDTASGRPSADNVVLPVRSGGRPDVNPFAAPLRGEVR